VTSAAAPPAKRCVVAWALRGQQHLWELELPAGATIAEALAAARAACGAAPWCAQIPWSSAPVGIFGEPRTRDDEFADGDRIELYRPLRRDPRERRRERVQRERAGRPRGGR
jgi:putative ubiquitin-RnfH superfamily antitoxin RatB of RatAB toxin-antitoxin module